MKRGRVESFTNKYLDRVIEQLKLPSDYALAEVLGISTQAIYKLRGGGIMSATTAAKVADLLQLDPLTVIADTELERASSPDDRKLWERIRAAAALAAFYVGAASFGVLPSPAHAQLPSQPGFNNNGIGIHIVRRRWPWWWPLA